MLRGNDPVSYFTSTAPLKGDPALKSVFDGDTYRFASADNKRLFDADPKQYGSTPRPEPASAPAASAARPIG